MKKLILFLFAATLMISCTDTGNMNSQNEGIQEVKAQDGLFLHISHGSDDPHRLLMALKMADLMSETKDVLVYFDIDAVHVVLKESENIEMEGFFPGSHEQLKKLIEKGVTLQVCPGCLNVAGKTADDVMEGVEIADKEKFFSFTEGRILSIDY